MAGTITTAHTNTLSFPAGSAFFDRFDTAGASTGFRDLGEAPTLELPVETETVDAFTTDTPIKALAASVTRQIIRRGTLTLNDMSLDNLALFEMGTKSTLSQGAATVTDEAYTVFKDRRTQIGVGTGFPAGAFSISAVTVKHTSGSPTYVEGTDYEYDANTALLYIISAGAITNGQSVKVTYTKAAKSQDQMAADATSQIIGAFLFVANNAYGPNTDIRAARCLLTPTGGLPWKTEAFQSMQFELKFLRKDGSTAPLYINGRGY